MERKLLSGGLSGVSRTIFFSGSPHCYASGKASAFTSKLRRCSVPASGCCEIGTFFHHPLAAPLETLYFGLPCSVVSCMIPFSFNVSSASATLCAGSFISVRGFLFRNFSRIMVTLSFSSGPKDCKHMC